VADFNDRAANAAAAVHGTPPMRGTGGALP
jgi:hypothetical protein